MSFSSTPLGQGRRLDHKTFLKGVPGSSITTALAPSNTNTSRHNQGAVPVSYAYGPPSLSSPSPKRNSPTRYNLTRDNLAAAAANPDDSISTNQKPRSKPQRPPPGYYSGPAIIQSPPKPTEYSAKDTTVNIASAINRAASDHQNMPSSHWSNSSHARPPNSNASASGSRSRPPNSGGPGPIPPARKQPLLRQSSSNIIVPDSEGEEDEPRRNGRGRTPLADAVSSAANGLAQGVNIILRRLSQEPEDRSHIASNSASYDYADEEQAFQEQEQEQEQAQAKKTHKPRRSHGAIDPDRKAYKPSASDLEDSDDYSSGDDKRPRRRKKKESFGGPLTSLPTVGADKRRKRKGRSKIPGMESVEEEEAPVDDDSGSIHSLPRGPLPPSRAGSRPPSRAGSAAPEVFTDDSVFQNSRSMDAIAEVAESGDLQADQRAAARKPTPVRRSVGTLLGSVLHGIASLVRGALFLVLQLFTVCFLLVGRVLGVAFYLIYTMPMNWLSRGAVMEKLAPIILSSLVLYFAYSTGRITSFRDLIPRLQFPSSTYRPPSAPPAELNELIQRLTQLEGAVWDQTSQFQRLKDSSAADSRRSSDLISRLDSLQDRVNTGLRQSTDSMESVRDATGKSLERLRQEMSELQDRPGGSEAPAEDETARQKVKEMEERMALIESTAREALELSKLLPRSDTGSHWWNKLGQSKTGLSIKSSDGRDVTALLEQLVDSTVALHSKDLIAKPDLALASAGGNVIPRLTSPTLEIKPKGVVRYLANQFFLGSGTVMGRSPVTALHHENAAGYCWPFAGSEGHLGIKLAVPAYVSEVTLDHVAKEVALDLSSAPRNFELWGLVEGGDNIAKLKSYRQSKARERDEARIEAELHGHDLPKDEDVHPSFLSHGFVRIGKAKYDIHAPSAAQTFPVLSEIQELGMDFGIVVIWVRDNWGANDWTCLYRVRVHGERAHPIPPPLSELD